MATISLRISMRLKIICGRKNLPTDLNQHLLKSNEQVAEAPVLEMHCPQRPGMFSPLLPQIFSQGIPSLSRSSFVFPAL